MACFVPWFAGGFVPVKSIKNVLSAIVALAVLALPAIALAGHEHDWNEGSRPFVWHDQGWHRGWFKHHRQVRPAEDEDDQGDYGPFGSPERPPAFLCDEDGDDCEPNSVDWGYGRYVPPISYDRDVPSAGYDLVQQHNWLLDHQRRAYNALTLMRARHDRNAMQRISTVIHGLDARIARDNRLLAGH
jgi:hypothetical protein